jgi:arylsulfatase A-like enzyme
MCAAKLRASTIALVAMVAAAAADARKAAPNIVHVVMDDIGWNDLGFMNKDILSPRIDTLVEESLLLTHFYTAKECAPTRGSAMTGRMPYHFGYYRNPSDEGGVPLEYALLPQILAAAPTPYSSHAIGKWHLGFKTPNHTATYRGFDTWMGYYHWGEDYFTHAFPPAYKGATSPASLPLSAYIQLYSSERVQYQI